MPRERKWVRERGSCGATAAKTKATFKMDCRASDVKYGVCCCCLWNDYGCACVYARAIKWMRARGDNIVSSKWWCLCVATNQQTRQTHTLKPSGGIRRAHHHISTNNFFFRGDNWRPTQKWEKTVEMILDHWMDCIGGAHCYDYYYYYYYYYHP